MLDKSSLDQHLSRWAKSKNLAGVSDCIMGPGG